MGRYPRVHLLILLLSGTSQGNGVTVRTSKFHIFLRKLRRKLVARGPIRGQSESVVLDTPGKHAHPQDAWANWCRFPWIIQDGPRVSLDLGTTFHCSHQLSYSTFTVPVTAKQWESSQAVEVLPRRSRIRYESDYIDPTRKHKFLFRIHRGHSRSVGQQSGMIFPLG